MTIHSFLPLVSAFSVISFAFFVYIKNKRSVINRAFFIFCFSAFIWLLGSSFMYSAPNKKIALAWAKFSYIGIISLPVFYYHLVVLLLKLKNQFLYIILSYIITGIFLFLNLTNHLLTDLYKYFWGYFYKTSPLHLIFILFFLLCFGKGLFLLYLNYFKKSQKQSIIERNRMKFILWAFTFAALGVIDFIPDFGLEFYPLGFVAAFAFVSTITYAILKHHLMDINIAIRKGLIYSALASIITASYFVIIFLLENIFRDFIGYKSIPLTIVTITLFIFIFQPLKNRIQYIVDKYFFKGTIGQIEQENIRLREKLQRSEKLKAVGTLAAGMAHEIKNPLTSIKTFTEYLSKKHQNKNFIDKFQRIVTAEVDKIDNIVKQLLDFAKPKALELKNSNIRNLIDEILDFLSNEFIKYKIKVIKNYKTSNLVIKIDPVQIKQVILNIVLNSIDAMKDRGGKLRISIENDEQQDTIKIGIEDTGCGIGKQDLPHLFDPFYSTKDTNTGLGLGIVHGIIEKHHGRIEVKSELEKGTKVTISLPKI